jgi:hypothetical protein
MTTTVTLTLTEEEAAFVGFWCEHGQTIAEETDNPEDLATAAKDLATAAAVLAKLDEVEQ